jgi:hypothetical protein
MIEEAAIMGESKPKSTDEKPTGSKPIEGVGTAIAALVVVSAIGSGVGWLRARRAARQRGAESST